MSYLSDNNVTADAAKAQSEYTPIPENTYPLTVIKAEEKKTQKGDPMLSLQFEVDMSDAGYIGRKLFANIMLDHANPTTRNIGQSQLHALLFMAKLDKISDATDLLGKSIVAKVKVQKRNDTGELQNVVVFARPKAAEAKTTAAPAASAPATKPASTSGW